MGRDHSYHVVLFLVFWHTAGGCIIVSCSIEFHIHMDAQLCFYRQYRWCISHFFIYGQISWFVIPSSINGSDYFWKPDIQNVSDVFSKVVLTYWKGNTISWIQRIDSKVYKFLSHRMCIRWAWGVGPEYFMEKSDIFLGWILWLFTSRYRGKVLCTLNVSSCSKGKELAAIWAELLIFQRRNTPLGKVKTIKSLKKRKSNSISIYL